MSMIDIVIPSAGRPQDLLRLLDSIHAQCPRSRPAHAASITVTDDRHALDLGAHVAARFPAVNYVCGPARGPAANRNHGASRGHAEWILFLDDDCYPACDIIDHYLRHAAAHPEVQVLEGPIHVVGERPNGNHHAPINLNGGYLWSCNFMIRRSEFERMGGFDECFPHAALEDCDFMTRLRAHGTPVHFAHDAVVMHPWRSMSETEIWRQIVGHAIMAEKHPRFAAGWNALHLLRAMRGRMRQYSVGRFASIPLAKYRTVGFDFIAPLVVYAVMRVAPLRRVLYRRYCNSRTRRPAGV